MIFKQISFDIPDSTPITGFAPFPATADDMYDMVAKYPQLFYIDLDEDDNDRLCMLIQFGSPMPVITAGLTEYPGRNYVVSYISKTEGDRGWHPSTKPPRPLV